MLRSLLQRDYDALCTLSLAALFWTLQYFIRSDDTFLSNVTLHNDISHQFWNLKLYILHNIFYFFVDRNYNFRKITYLYRYKDYYLTNFIYFLISLRLNH